jgi:hypothetical protein
MKCGDGWKANYRFDTTADLVSTYVQLDVVCWGPNEKGKIVGFVTFSTDDGNGELTEAPKMVLKGNTKKEGKFDTYRFAGYSKPTNPPDDICLPGDGHFSIPYRALIWDWRTGKTVPMDVEIQTLADAFDAGARL